MNDLTQHGLIGGGGGDIHVNDTPLFRSTSNFPFLTKDMSLSPPSHAEPAVYSTKYLGSGLFMNARLVSGNTYTFRFYDKEANPIASFNFTLDTTITQTFPLSHTCKCPDNSGYLFGHAGSIFKINAAFTSITKVKAGGTYGTDSGNKICGLYISDSGNLIVFNDVSKAYILNPTTYALINQPTMPFLQLWDTHWAGQKVETDQFYILKFGGGAAETIKLTKNVQADVNPIIQASVTGGSSSGMVTDGTVLYTNASTSLRRHALSDLSLIASHAAPSVSYDYGLYRDTIKRRIVMLGGTFMAEFDPSTLTFSPNNAKALPAGFVNESIISNGEADPDNPRIFTKGRFHYYGLQKVRRNG